MPIEEAGWYAHANYRGARIMVDEHRSPSAAALALAERILHGGRCKCGQPVTLSDDQPGCRWQLMGKQWQPTCTAEPVHVHAERGDLGAMQAAMSRRARRAAKRQARAADERTRSPRRREEGQALNWEGTPWDDSP